MSTLDIAKNASSTYDVSKETGEDLVDSAHPEGSAPVTGVNTSDVVETITEQQKKDIEIISKEPTGKYAELITLADELDRTGLYSYADKVDELIKVASDSINLVEKALENELSKPTLDLFKIEKLKEMLKQQRGSLHKFPAEEIIVEKGKMSVKPKVDVARFRSLYNQYLRETNPQKANEFPPNTPWGVAKFNAAWKDMGGIAGVEKKLNEALTKKISPAKTTEMEKPL